MHNWYRTANDSWFGMDIPDNLPSEEESFEFVRQQMEDDMGKDIENLKRSGYKEHGGVFFQVGWVSIPALDMGLGIRSNDFGGGSYAFEIGLNYVSKLQTLSEGFKFPEGRCCLRAEGHIEIFEVHTHFIFLENLIILKGSPVNGDLSKRKEFWELVHEYLKEELVNECSELKRMLIAKSSRL